MTNYTPSDADPGFVRQRVREMDPANNSKYNAMDDIASSLIFAAVYRDCLRYNGTSKSWYVYDGVKWKPDNDDLTVERYAKILARELWIYASDLRSKQFPEYVCKLQERRRRRTMIDDARDLLPVSQADFDRDPYLFNCQNGILDLRDLSFREHDPNLLLSKAANVTYDPDAACGAFDAFMDQITEGDRAKAAYLQTMFGYAMTGKNELEECVMLYGATTRNGKGTLTNTIKHHPARIPRHAEEPGRESGLRRHRPAERRALPADVRAAQEDEARRGAPQDHDRTRFHHGTASL